MLSRNFVKSAAYRQEMWDCLDDEVEISSEEDAEEREEEDVDLHDPEQVYQYVRSHYNGAEPVVKSDSQLTFADLKCFVVEQGETWQAVLTRLGEKTVRGRGGSVVSRGTSALDWAMLGTLLRYKTSQLRTVAEEDKIDRSVDVEEKKNVEAQSISYGSVLSIKPKLRRRRSQAEYRCFEERESPSCACDHITPILPRLPGRPPGRKENCSAQVSCCCRKHWLDLERLPDRGGGGGQVTGVGFTSRS